jgi:hypothetical protein
MSDQPFDQDTTEARIQALFDEGQTLSSQSREKIVALGAQATPRLVEILGDKKLWDDKAPGEGYAPIHAAEILGAIGDKDALGPLYDVLVEVEPDAILDDALTDAIRSFGRDAVRAGLARLDSWDDPFLEVLAYVFAGLPAHHQTARHQTARHQTARHQTARHRTARHQPEGGDELRSEKVFQVLLKYFIKNPVPGAGLLAEYGDPTAIDALDVALERYIAAAGGDTKYRRPIFQLADAIEELGGTLTKDQRRHIGALKARRTRSEEVMDQLANKDAPDHSATYQKPRDVGRNEPCWCGSGVKYKRCHWAEDQT